MFRSLLKFVAGADVVDLYDDGHGKVRSGFTAVANNLPGVMQYLDLVRDAASVFGLERLPRNRLEMFNEMTKQNYAQEDARMNRHAITSEPFDKEALLDKREKAKMYRKKKKADARPSSGSNTEPSFNILSSINSATSSVETTDEDDSGRFDELAEEEEERGRSGSIES